MMALLVKYLFWTTMLSVSVLADIRMFFSNFEESSSPVKARRIDHQSADQNFDQSFQNESPRYNERKIENQNVQEEEKIVYQINIEDSYKKTRNEMHKTDNTASINPVWANTTSNLEKNQRRPNIVWQAKRPVFNNNKIGPTHLKSNEQAASNNRTADNIVFPGPTSRPSTPSFIPQVPENCIKQGFCENVIDYPEEYIASVVEKLQDVTSRFKVDEILSPKVDQRIGPPSELELCDYREEIWSPQVAQDKDGVWRYIVNNKKKPLQGIRVEICRKPNKKCNDDALTFFLGYEAKCRQKYILRYLTAIDEHGKLIDTSFKLPSCCACIIKQID